MVRCVFGGKVFELVGEGDGRDGRTCKKAVFVKFGKDNLISMLCGMYIDAPPPQTSSHSLMNVGGEVVGEAD